MKVPYTRDEKKSTSKRDSDSYSSTAVAVCMCAIEDKRKSSRARETEKAKCGKAKEGNAIFTMLFVQVCVLFAGFVRQWQKESERPCTINQTTQIPTQTLWHMQCTPIRRVLFRVVRRLSFLSYALFSRLRCAFSFILCVVFDVCCFFSLLFVFCLCIEFLAAGCLSISSYFFDSIACVCNASNNQSAQKKSLNKSVFFRNSILCCPLFASSYTFSCSLTRSPFQ